MKWWHSVLVLLGVVLLIRWNRRAVEAQKRNAGEAARAAAAGRDSAAASRAADGQALVRVVAGLPIAVSTDPREWTLADQERYPGWYITGDGGYWNPETKEYYSPGSSPVVYRTPERPTISIDVDAVNANYGVDPTTDGRASADETRALGYDFIR